MVVIRGGRVFAGAAVVALVGVGCLNAVAAADAVPTTSDPASLGGVALFDDVGTPLTSGPDLAHWADFAVAGNSGNRAAGEPVTLSAAIVHADEPAAAWPVTVLVGGAGSAPATATSAALPAALLPLAGWAVDTGKSRLSDALPADADSADDQSVLVQLRLSNSTRADADYWSTYLKVDPATDRWHVASAAAGDEPVTPALAAPTVGLGEHGIVVVTGSVAPTGGARPTGWIELFDRDADRGAGAYDAATGNVTAKVLPDGDQSGYHFVFTPADTVDYTSAESSSTGCACGASGQPTSAPTSRTNGAADPGSSPSDPSSADASASTGSTASTKHSEPARVAVTVTPPANKAAYGNTVILVNVFPDVANGAVTVHAGSSFSATVPVVGGRATLTTNSLGAGTHVVSATFTPRPGSGYAAGSAASAPFTLVASAAPDRSGGVAATIEPGPLTISTPYGPGHPLELGSLALSTDGSRLLTKAHIGTAADAAHDGITITDTRSGDPGWSASLLATNLTNGSDQINAQNVGFVDVHCAAVAGYGGGGLGTTKRPVRTHDIKPSTNVASPTSSGAAGLARVPKVFASAKHGRGSVYIFGDLLLQAPTSAVSGEYTATLTFTVS